MNILEALDAIAAIEGSLAVDVDGLGNFRVEHAYAAVPSGRRGQVSVPCWLNTASYNKWEMVNGQRRLFYTVRPQMLLSPLSQDLEDWTRVAWQFHMAFVDAMGRALKLGGGADVTNLRGAGSESGGGTVVLLPWNDTDHIGLDYIFDLRLHDNFDPGA